jgi:cytochrome c553
LQGFGKLTPIAVAASAMLVAFVAVAPLSLAGSGPKMDAGNSRMITAAPAEMQPCMRCHGPELSGKPGRTPSLRSSGVLKHYTKKQFERVMATGMTNDGGMVWKSMPVFHWKADQADQAYAYLKKLK